MSNEIRKCYQIEKTCQTYMIRFHLATTFCCRWRIVLLSFKSDVEKMNHKRILIEKEFEKELVSQYVVVQLLCRVLPHKMMIHHNFNRPRNRDREKKSYSQSVLYSFYSLNPTQAHANSHTSHNMIVMVCVCVYISIRLLFTLLCFLCFL